MTIAESRRLALFESAKASWGADTAQTLMDLLPPDPDALATKADLAVLGAELRAEMAGQTRTLVLAMLTIEVTIVLAVLGAVVAR
ncbi:MAG TPA: hypothetical protein VNQ33_02765 [Acidimicrobiales bacterium]|nr:hypothetical protein [Acidimicrobiales bacterium]